MTRPETVDANVRDGEGNRITSTKDGGKRRLDVDAKITAPIPIPDAINTNVHDGDGLKITSTEDAGKRRLDVDAKAVVTGVVDARITEPVNVNVRDGTGNLITSTVDGTKRRLDVDAGTEKVWGYFYWYHVFTYSGAYNTLTSFKISDILNGSIGSLTKSWTSLPSLYYVKISTVQFSQTNYNGYPTNRLVFLGLHNTPSWEYFNWFTIYVIINNPYDMAYACNQNVYPGNPVSPDLYLIHYYSRTAGTADVTNRINVSGLVCYII